MYDDVQQDQGLSQGDIFSQCPLLLHRIGKSIVISEDEEPGSPQDLTDSSFDDQKDIWVAGRIIRSPVLLISQSCDAERANLLTVLRILPITLSSPGFDNKGLKGKVEYIKELRDSISIFYLRETEYIPKSLVRFDEMLTIHRNDLIALKRFRQHRLNAQAVQHLQDKLAAFFSRYAFDDSYMFDDTELAEYKQIVAAGEEKRRNKEDRIESERSW